MAITAALPRSSLPWLALVAALIWIATLSNPDRLGTIGYLIPFILTAAIIPAFVIFRATQGRSYAIASILVLVVLLVDWKTSPGEEFEIKWETVAKVLTWVALIGVAATQWRKIWRLFREPVVILLFAHISYALISALWSEVPVFSAAGALGHLAYALLACTIVVNLRDQNLIRLLVWLWLALVCSAYIATAAVPDVGWYPPAADEGVYAWRIQGFSGHPNILGGYAAILILTATAARRTSLINWPMACACVSIGIVTSLLTESRTSLIAVAVALGLVELRKSRFRGVITIVILGVLGFCFLLAACSAFPDISGLLAIFSRSGRASEVTTLTGRTDLWDIAWANIKLKPIFGWGYYGTIDLIRSSADPKIAMYAKHAHNMFLQSLLQAGILGSLPGFAILFLLIVRFVTQPDPTRDQMTIFVLIHGFGEAGIFGLPIMTTIYFYWILVREAEKWLPRRTI